MSSFSFLKVLAMNRGEDLKILSLKVVIPDHIAKNWKTFCYDLYVKGKENILGVRDRMVIESIEDAYDRIGTCFNRVPIKVH